MAKKTPAGPPKEKPKKMTIHEVKRTRRHIYIAYDLGGDVLTVRSPDNPLPKFFTALDALGGLVAVVCQLPPAYCETGLKVGGMVLKEQCGVPNVSIIAQKSLDDASKALVLVTPPRLLETPKAPGTYNPPLIGDDKDKVEELIEQAKAYVKGDRAQGQLALDEDAEDDEKPDPGANTGELPLAPDNGGMGQPAKKKRRGKIVPMGAP